MSFTIAMVCVESCKQLCSDCSFVTGGEDGYVRMNHFDATYFNLLTKQEL